MAGVKNRIVVAVATALVLALASPALAVDGTIEINHDAIVASPTGYPFTIAQAGSYRLTSNLVVTAGKDGIFVSPAVAFGFDVTVDLNGFRIISAGSGTSPTTGISGVQVVYGGTVRGFDTGVERARDAHDLVVFASTTGFSSVQEITRCHVDVSPPSDGAATGVALARTVRDCFIAVFSTTDAKGVEEATSVTASVVDVRGAAGSSRAVRAGQVSDCLVFGEGAKGYLVDISGQDGGVVRGCRLFNNATATLVGVIAGTGALIVECSIKAQLGVTFPSEAQANTTAVRDCTIRVPATGGAFFSALGVSITPGAATDTGNVKTTF
jgi:hypothetical protein